VQAPTLFVSETKFSIPDSEITQIIISRDTLQAELKKSDDGLWLINGEAVNSDIVDNLIFALSQQQISFPVPISLNQRAMQKLEKEGFRLKVYSNNSKKLDFKISEIDTLCIGLVTRKKQPYALAIPGFSEKTIEFVSSNPAFYRNNIVLKYLPSEIESITVENIKNPENSFTIFQNANNNLMLFDIKNKNFLRNFNEGKIRVYLSYFNGVEYSKMLNLSRSEFQQISNYKPSYILTVKTRNKTISLKITEIPLFLPRERYGQIKMFDTDNFYLLMNDSQEIALAKWVNFDILLKKLSDFVNK
jgi:hypothetical protein